jgi:putative heme-binding domain-containing protein
LRPSEEVAPRYQSWELRTTGGRSYFGQRLPEAGDNGSEEYTDATGARFQLASEDIETRRPSSLSIMPDGLEKLISLEDLRDLLTFLTPQR